MRWVIVAVSALVAFALVLPAGGQNVGKKIGPVRVVILMDATTKGVPAEAAIERIETTGPAVGKRVVNEVRKKGTREELKRFAGIYATQGAKVTLRAGATTNCNLLLSEDVGKATLRDVKYVSAFDAITDRGMGAWYCYTAEFDKK